MHSRLSHGLACLGGLTIGVAAMSILQGARAERVKADETSPFELYEYTRTIAEENTFDGSKLPLPLLLLSEKGKKSVTCDDLMKILRRKQRLFALDRVFRETIRGSKRQMTHGEWRYIYVELKRSEGWKANEGNESVFSSIREVRELLKDLRKQDPELQDLRIRQSWDVP